MLLFCGWGLLSGGFVPCSVHLLDHRTTNQQSNVWSSSFEALCYPVWPYFGLNMDGLLRPDSSKMHEIALQPSRKQEVPPQHFFLIFLFSMFYFVPYTNHCISYYLILISSISFDHGVPIFSSGWSEGWPRRREMQWQNAGNEQMLKLVKMGNKKHVITRPGFENGLFQDVNRHYIIY